MYLRVVFLIATCVTLKYFIDLRDWLDWGNEKVFDARPGPCHIVINDGGSEDVTHIGDGIVLLSTGFNFEGRPGKIMAVQMKAKSTAISLNITNVPATPDFMASPHGISTWTDSLSGKMYLYVISHAPKEDRIEVFEVLKPLALLYTKTITDPRFTMMNDLVVVDKDTFYITKWTQYRDTRLFSLEMLSQRRYGEIYFYDGHKAKEVATGYFMPNGINISPDKKVIYMGEWGAKTLRGFRRESTNNLVEIWSQYIGTGIDGIEVDPDTGDLWIGSHPVTWKIIDPGIFGSIPPSQVLHVKMVHNMVSEVQQIFADDGYSVSGAASATFVNGSLLIGTLKRQTAVCEVRYIDTNGYL